jgi:plastocyanin
MEKLLKNNKRRPYMNKTHFGEKLAIVTLALLLGVMPAYASGTITGKVAFEGTPPVLKPINFGAEKQCAAMHGDKMPTNEDIVVNPNGTVKWALVYLKEGVPPAAVTPSEPIVIDQKGCVFQPHVTVAQVNQKIIFKNNDSVLHNVRAVAKKNKSFNIAQPIQGMETAKIFDQPEIGILLRCDVHFWMASYLHVLNNPYYAVTGDDGTFSINDVPPGTYTLEIWHEKLGTRTAEVTVAEGESKISDFTLKQA